jgi:RNA polymerase sigma-70 factor (ECF subfamily)
VHQLLGRRDHTNVPLDPERVVEARDDLRRVGELIATLKRRDQILLGLRVASELSHSEIAQVMGMSTQAVRVAIHRSIDKIRKQWESQDED